MASVGNLGSAAPPPPKLSPKEQKKLDKLLAKQQKERDNWQLFLDFLFRHITITTSKYIEWEKKGYEGFKGALEKAQRLDPKNQSDAPSLKKLSLRYEILEEKGYIAECRELDKYFDLIERMRGLHLVAKDFVKVAQKSKLKPMKKLEESFEHWKNFVTVGNNFWPGLHPQDLNPQHPGMKYACWVVLFRSILKVANQYMEQATTLCEMELTPDSPYIGFNLSLDQQAICGVLQEAFVYKKPEEAAFGMGAMGGGKKKKKEEEEVVVGLPGQNEYLTFVLPKMKKGGPQKGKGKGKK